MSNSVASAGDASANIGNEVEPSPVHAVSTVEPQNPFDTIGAIGLSSSTESSMTQFAAPLPQRTTIKNQNAPSSVLVLSPASGSALTTNSPTSNMSLPCGTTATQFIPSNNLNSNEILGSIEGRPLFQVNPNMAATTTEQMQPGDVATMHSEDDADTAPSSAANTLDHQRTSVTSHDDEDNPAGSHHRRNSSVARFIENTRKRLYSHHRKDSDDDVADDQMTGALIAGYLQKLGRNGKWQTRWFETDGECLSYYKTSKRTKLLATLDLQKVGLIEIDLNDSDGCSFVIQVLGRLYHLRAEGRAACKDWVITLNRIKEARLQQGNVKLVGLGGPLLGLDLLDDHRNSNRSLGSSAPRVVVVANRQRTRAVDEEEQWDKLIRVPATHGSIGDENPEDPAYINQKRHSALSNAVVARWSKRHSSLQRLGAKLSKWARSLKKLSCADVEREKIYLDRHVHPPGHDVKGKSELVAKQQQQTKQKGLSGWIDKETINTSGASMPAQPSANNTSGAMDAVKPGQLGNRSLSLASEYDTRLT